MELTEKQTVKELMIKYGFTAPDMTVTEFIEDILPSAQPEPSEITDEQAILHLQSTGWMQNHDKEMYESWQKSMLEDDSGSYDALIPDCYKAKKRFYNLSFLQPESECVFYDNDHGFCINTQDVVDNLNNQK